MTLTMTTASPFMSLHAANLWNSKNGNNTIPRYVPQSKEKAPLFNRRSNKNNNKYHSKGLRESIEGYANTQYSTVIPSKLDGLVSQNALINRNNDLNDALKIEHETRKANAAYMIKQLKENDKFRQKSRRDAEEDRLSLLYNPVAYKIEKIRKRKNKESDMRRILSSRSARQMMASRKEKREKHAMMQAQSLDSVNDSRKSSSSRKSSMTTSTLYNIRK